MKPAAHTSRLRKLLPLAIAATLACSLAAAADPAADRKAALRKKMATMTAETEAPADAAPVAPGATPAARQADPSALVFGEVMYDYYNERNFQSVTKLLIARDRKLLTERDDYAEMLLGDLYTSFGLIDQAEQIFSRLVKRDILARTRNETWFHTAELQYNQGRFDEAARILENKVPDLPPQMEKERLLMLGNIYILRGEFQRAAELLGNTRADDVLGAYTIYNSGVAFIRAGEIDRGLPLLKRVRDIPPGDEEMNALKDRAAIAIGFTWLQKGNHDLARESLLTVRMDGPFTNQAMLGLGYANFQRGDYKKALPLWLELLQRNTSDTSVQEALMLAPRAYEELGAAPQALFGYRYAADTLRNELKKVERTIIRVREADWLNSLSPETAPDALVASDPLAPVSNTYTPANAPEAPYLYALFASKDFAQEYKLYLELKRIERLLDFWAGQLPVYTQMLNQHRARMAPMRAEVDEVIARRSRDLGELRMRYPAIKSRIEAAIKRGDSEQTASLENLALLDRVRLLEARYGGSPATAERIRRIRGQVQFNIAREAPQQQQRAFRELAELKNELDLGQVHLNSLQQLRADIERRMGTDYDRRIAGLAERIRQYKGEVNTRLQNQTIALQNQALVVLAENRRNLGAQLAETHLAIARLQDASVSEAIEKRKRQ